MIYYTLNLQVNKNIILFMESCIYPFGYIINFNDLIFIKQQYNFFIIIDNSLLSINNFNPFIYKVDIVTESLTKKNNDEIKKRCAEWKAHIEEEYKANYKACIKSIEQNKCLEWLK